MDTEVGFVTTIKDFLIYLDGLPSIRINDFVQSESGVRGWVNALLPNSVEVLLLDEGAVQPGQMFKKMPQKLEALAGDFLLGRAVNSLSVPIDGKGILSKTRSAKSVDLDREAPGIQSREFIKTQFETGITLVDTLIPLGRGQRELVLGDPRSGKTRFLMDLIVNQKGKNTVCIYTSIGKPLHEVRTLIDVFEANEALSYTCIIAAASSDPAPLIYLAPKTALAVAEYFKDAGKDVLVILDDLGAHAKIYREMALLAGHFPGRESYPGDIFYQHGHLIERAGNFNQSAGGGSITCIPAMEIDLNDFTTFIPTNLMAMTDGHLLFKSSMYNLGQRPAIDVSLSVSRIGQQTQNRVQNLLSARIKQILIHAKDLETLARFSSEITPESQMALHQQKLIFEMLKQEPFSYISLQVQTVLLGLVFTEFLKSKRLPEVVWIKDLLIKAFSKDPALKAVASEVFNLKDDAELITKLEGLKPRLDTLTQKKEATDDDQTA